MNSKLLKILHFSTADNEGGSARSAYRIHNGIRKFGISSRMLVGKKVTDDLDIALVAGSQFGRFFDLFMDRYNRWRGHQYLSVPSSARVPGHPWIRDANIIQLFNTHGGYFSHTILPELSKIAPIVWRLSDMWPMTPHAAYTYGCECYKKGPENCVCELSSYPGISRDTKKKLWAVKEKIYSESNITIVAPSSWIYKAARESILLSRFKVHKISNGIDLNVFYPRDRLKAREKFGIDPQAKVILFSAHGLDKNSRKGSEILIDMLNRLGPQSNVLLLLAGTGGDSFLENVPLPVLRLGYIADRNTMAFVYSAADFIVVPSIVENLPNNLLEAMACGTAAVAFDAGGMGDAVCHLETGYLARFGDRDDFVKGMSFLLKDDELRGQLGKKSHALAREQFDEKKEVESFIKLYESLVPQNR